MTLFYSQKIQLTLVSVLMQMELTEHSVLTCLTQFQLTSLVELFGGTPLTCSTQRQQQATRLNITKKATLTAAHAVGLYSSWIPLTSQGIHTATLVWLSKIQTATLCELSSRILTAMLIAYTSVVPLVTTHVILMAFQAGSISQRTTNHNPLRQPQHRLMV